MLDIAKAIIANTAYVGILETSELLDIQKALINKIVIYTLPEEYQVCDIKKVNLIGDIYMQYTSNSNFPIPDWNNKSEVLEWAKALATLGTTNKNIMVNSVQFIHNCGKGDIDTDVYEDVLKLKGYYNHNARVPIPEYISTIKGFMV